MKKSIAAALVIALVLILCAGCANKNAYEQAAGLFDAGDYTAAMAMFDELAAEEYEDSALRATECRYQLALALYEAGDLAAAEQAMLAMDGYANSADIAAACRLELDNAAAYAEAVELMESDPAAARELFLTLGDYQDSPLRADMCVNRMGYTVTYMEKTYTVEPLALGTGEDGNVTLRVRFNELIIVEFDEGISIVIPPASASVFVDGREYAYTEGEMIPGENECVFKFGTPGSVTQVDLYATGAPTGERYSIAPETLIP